MFNTWMTSDWLGSCVANPRRIDGPAITVARLRHDQGELLGVVAMRRFGVPTA